MLDVIPALLNLLWLVLSSTNLSWRICIWKEYVSAAFEWITFIWSDVTCGQCPCPDAPCGSSVRWCEWGEVPSCYVAVGFSLYVFYRFPYSFRCSYVRCIYNCCVFFLESPLDHYVLSLFVSCNTLYFKVYFSGISTASWLCLDFRLHQIPFFVPLAFGLCIFRSEVCLLSAIYVCTGLVFVSECSQPLCLLTGAFNPLTSKVLSALSVPAVILTVLRLLLWFFPSSPLLLFLFSLFCGSFVHFLSCSRPSWFDGCLQCCVWMSFPVSYVRLS